ncbi:unnamed protein product [Phaedon cochleariae]|uniref:RanBP-type and C3HC4-type zinc finger-containing protein 1 n=1 Tax=Phaedon cochleariae TaxID=80249 RepID=A0A9P0E067_PHACE|nr:unnamed protein product [Phaedon cochleariae]
MSLKEASPEQSIGRDPKSKRNSGLFAFFKWFKPSASRESIDVEPQISSSTSSDSLNSIHSAGTVASFSFVPASAYKKCVSEKCIAPGPETDTYKARLKQRDKRRENDKNLTLRKKYNLFFHRDTLQHPITVDEENSKSLPLMTRGVMEIDEEPKVHRRTNSESSKIRKSGYTHVKGKRKAPQPPMSKTGQDGMSTASLRRTKRLAPAPPPVDKIIETLQDEQVVCNDYLKLDHGYLRPVRDTGSISPVPDKAYELLSTSPKLAAEAPVSPRPWYKRNTIKDSVSSKKDKADHKYEPIERLPEVPFSRNSTLDLTIEDKKKEEKRKSGMSFLTNISELDREAYEIVRNKDKDKNLEEMPEFMRPKEEKGSTDSWVSPKRRSARDLIAKFNAITNVTKVTVFGASQKDTKFFGKQTSLDDAKRRQEFLLETHKKRIDEIDKKNTPLAKSESSKSVTQKPDTPKFERKSWVCRKCNLENEYWRIICHVCSSIKPYFDDFSSSSKGESKIQVKASSPLVVKKEKSPPQKFDIERSKTQIGFSALASYNKPKIERTVLGEEQSQKELDTKKEEREKLKRMLIEMKNSLPKRKSHVLLKQNSRKSIIVENSEVGEEIKESGSTEGIGEKSSGSEENITKESDISKGTETVEIEKTQEEKIAEILIGTTQTIYENIKIRKTENPKPLKVSSSVQTSAVVKQVVPGSSLNNLIKSQSKNNHYELMRPKDFENIYSDTNAKSAAKIYANLARNDELSLFFNVPKTLKYTNNGSKTVNHTDTIEINRLLKKLESSISKGELVQASDYAKELAQLRVSCSVIRQKAVVPSLGEKKIRVEMYVEDKVSHRGPFSVEVSQDQTVAQLKLQIEKEYEIPAAFQKWILGKELVTDDKTTLRDHNVTTEGCPVFLYLVAPDGKGITVQKANSKIDIKNLPSTSRLSILVDEAEKKKTSEMIDITTKQTGSTQKAPKENEDSKSEQKTIDHVPKIINVIRKGSEPSSKPEKTHEKIDLLPTTSRDKLEKIITVKPSMEVKPIIQYVFPTIQNSYQTEAVPENPKTLTKEKEKPTSTNLQSSTGTASSSIATFATEPAKIPDTSPIPPKAEIEATVEYESTTLKPSTDWECHLCTLLNPSTSNVCAVCATVRLNKPKPTEANVIRETAKADMTYLQLVHLDNADLVENAYPFECMICFAEIAPREGCTLRECLHQFCKGCLAHTIEFAEEAAVECPYRDNVYSCNIALQDREVKALVEPQVYERHLAKSMAQAENKIDKTFHCKTPDCKGWCIFEDNVNEFRCPVCKNVNCLTCQAIHMGMNCKRYQEQMTSSSENDTEAKRTKKMLEEMVKNGEAIECPTCKVILMKKWGCDWLRCSMCKTEICWVTRGPRWGPAGKGDTSGGCQCGVNGVKCHPKCNYCH